MKHIKNLSKTRQPVRAEEITTKSGCKQFSGDQAKKCQIAVKAGLTVITDP